MTPEQAKFTLQSFRPDGADAHDQDFADALALAAENRELGEWLARERAMDAAFSEALASIELPDHLREDIIGCLNGGRADFPEADDPQDAMMIGAMASVKPPASLRGDILAAMTATANHDSQEAEQKVTPFWKGFGMPIAAAAGIALAFFITRNGSSTPSLAQNAPLPPSVVQANFIQTYNSPSFRLDFKQDDQAVLVENLKSRSLPCPSCLPPGLENVKSIGCRELIINGKHGSLICFRKDGTGVVHLVIFRKSDVDGSFPTIEDPEFTTQGNWAVAQWQNDDKVFMLIGDTEVKRLAQLF